MQNKRGSKQAAVVIDVTRGLKKAKLASVIITITIRELYMSVQKVLSQPVKWLSQGLVIASFTLHAQAYQYIDETSLSDESSLSDAIEKGKASLDFRLRYEDARQSAEPEQGAQAATLRSRLSYQTQRYLLLSAYLQLDDIRAIPNDDNYNSGSNGEFDDVFVGEPESTRISQAWLNYDIVNTSISYGRQSFQLDQGRMLGSDSWYQNEQTFTGLTIINQSLNYTRLAYAKFTRVEQPYTKYAGENDESLRAQLFNLNYRGFRLNDLSIYRLDISDHPSDRRWETRTIGIHVAGKAGGNNGLADAWGNREGEDFSIAYLFEFARQDDSGRNPMNYRADYRQLELVAAYQGASITLGQEVLGADGDASFVTPLASLHDYQGSAGQAVDQALGNVTGGIVDTRFGLSYRCSDSFSLALMHHDYKFDQAPSDRSSIGTEIEATARLKLNELRLLAKYADYRGEALGEDTRRIWLQAGIAF